MRISELCAALAFAGALAGCSASSVAEPDEVAPDEVVMAPLEGADWELVWSDEFDGDSLDRTKWTPEQSCWGGGNEERQCYTDRTENVLVQDGHLLLRARKESFTGPDRPPEIAADPNPQVTQEFTSGKVRTRGLHSWRYGRIEARARVPAGQGLWPAFWMMPAQDVYGGWPLSGEIDILEAVNVGARCEECDGDVGENRTVSALHFGDLPPDNRYVDAKSALPDLSLPSDDFHVYSVEWGEGLIQFLVDDRVHAVFTSEDWDTGSSKAVGNANAPFDQPFYVMANLAVGGRWPERDNEKGLAPESVPAQFELDWIRVYQCAGDRETGLACMQ